MAKRFDFRVCCVQDARVTFVNGEWQGKIATTAITGDPDNDKEVLNSCTYEWEYLLAAGVEGWDLIAAVGRTTGDQNIRLLYLRRELS